MREFNPRRTVKRNEDTHSPIEWGACVCRTAVGRELQPGLDVLLAKLRRKTREANQTLAIDEEHTG